MISILPLCTEPVKLSNLTKWFNYKNEKNFRDKYIKPLREVGFISLTNEQNPTTPENNYRITVEGIRFLTKTLD